jgi:phosphoribosylamine---glycine ligase
MNILLLGNGGREHALAWKLAQSPQCKQLFIAPGNAGTALEGTNVAIPATDLPAIGRFASEHHIDMVVAGPEGPLSAGVVDYFRNDVALRHIPVIGPVQAAAQLEGSKAFAKGFMARHSIPTAGYAVFGTDGLRDAFKYMFELVPPIVLKADGLAAGKGVIICDTHEQARDELKAMLEGKFGKASETVVIEEFLDGMELSVFVFTDGTNYTILPTAKDYKRAGEYDTGLNTGGMGAISPVPFADDMLMRKVEERIIRPTIKGLKAEGLDYTGVIYFGLMNVGGDPFVIEYNVRFGDPEAEVLVPKIKTDLVEIFRHIANRTLEQLQIEFDRRPAATVMLVSGGYPGDYESGKPISGLEKVVGSLVFHAGTKPDNGNVLTAGGRVLAITSLADTLPEALAISKRNAELVQFEGRYFRPDIGYEFVEE